MFTAPIGLINPKVGGVSRNGLIREWLFSGNANDTSGNGDNGTVTGAVLTTDRHSVANSAYLFTGSPNTIIFSQSTMPVPMSISLWVNFTSYARAFVFANRGVSTVNFQFFLDNDNHFYFYLMTDGLVSKGYDLGLISLATWHNFIITMEGTTGGKLIIKHNNTVIIDFTFDYNVNSSNANMAMSNITPFGLYFDGKLDDVRIYDRIITNTEATALYNE